MEQFEWDSDKIFVSNNGAGPLAARILCVADGVAKMERWNKKRPVNRTRFTLPVWFLSSPQCGWKSMLEILP